jgi:hypothetical protein
MWGPVELFANLDLALISVIIDNTVTSAFQPVHWDGTAKTLGDVTAGMLSNNLIPLTTSYLGPRTYPFFQMGSPLTFPPYTASSFPTSHTRQPTCDPTANPKSSANYRPGKRRQRER